MPARTTSRFLPQGAPFTFERFDQGEDFRTTPGGRVIAPWAGSTTLAPKDPGGFGTHYALYHPSEGPYKGRTFYIGHAWGIVRNNFSAGSTIALTGRGVEGWMGNAKGIPGHVEIGFWPPGSMTSGRNVAPAVQGAPGAGTSWTPCTLTWYDPALGGKNSGSGAKDPTARTSSGEAYNASAFTCAAPPHYPFGTHITFKYRGRMVACRVNDRGGAIVGHHFDLSRAAGEKLGIIGAGKVNAEFSVGSVAADPGTGKTRPGGEDPHADDAALETAWRHFYADDPGGTAPAASEVAFFGAEGQTALISADSAGAGNTIPVGLNIPGIKIPGLPFRINPLQPGIPLPPSGNPLDTFKDTLHAVNSVVDFLKWVSWIFHPRNMLRYVEFVAGFWLMVGGLICFIQAHKSGSGRGGRGGRSGRRQRTVKRVQRIAKYVPGEGQVVSRASRVASKSTKLRGDTA